MTTTTSSGPVWAKGTSRESGVDELNISYCAGRDVRPRPEADLALVPYDLATNAAHAIMLGDTEIIRAEERRALLGALLQIREETEAGTPLLDPQAEDIHMSVENRVTALAGAGMGGRLHTGRSRNDQVATDMRQWLRDQIFALSLELRDLARVLQQHAREHAATACPGMTHMQPAMVTTWGHWVTSYLARIVRDMRHAGRLLDELLECPLGAAASFGTSWPIDRERTADLLGFNRASANTVDSIWSRGEMETRFAFLAAQILGHLSSMGQDLILLSSPPRKWLRLPDEFVTGSSIMPQKRNPDFAEVTRARAASASGIVQSLLSIGIAAPGGYNRDTQWTKYLVMDVAEEVRGAATLFARLFERIRVNADEMLAAADQGFMNATDVADYLSSTRNLPFRDCYRVLGQAVVACEKNGKLDRQAINVELAKLDGEFKPLTVEEMARFENPVLLVGLRSQTGSPNPEKVLESVKVLGAEMEDVFTHIDGRAHKWRTALMRLWKLARQIAEEQ